MSNVAIIASHPRSLVNFRGDLIRAIVAGGHEVVALSERCDPDVVEEIERCGAELRSFRIQRNSTNPLADLVTLHDLRALLKELDPDVVLAYTIKPVIWGGIALRGVRGARFYPLITGLGYSFHDAGLKRRMLTGLVTWLYRLALARASGVIFQNQENRDEIIHRKLVSQADCSVVDGSGVNLSRFPRMPLPSDGAVFLVIARLLAAKGLHDYYEAAKRVKEEFPQAEFRLLGRPDPSRDAIGTAEIRRWEGEGMVHYKGETADVRPYLRDCHVFVLPSYYQEGVPRTLLEALAVGRPIISTDNVGCREAVIPGENGFIVRSVDGATWDCLNVALR